MMILKEISTLISMQCYTFSVYQLGLFDTFSTLANTRPCGAMVILH